MEEKIKMAALIYLKNKIKLKGKEIIYNDLKCQNYLLPNNTLSLEQQLDIFSYRVRMNKLKYNFQGNSDIIQTRICENVLNNEHLYYCEVLNEGRKCDVSYMELFNGNLRKQKIVVNILHENMENFETFSQAQ